MLLNPIPTNPIQNWGLVADQGIYPETVGLERVEPEENYIITYTGKKFHFLNPTEEEIDIRDIAHHLSNLCRFTGATRTFYSVGQHSIHVAELCPPELRLAALLHDAAEAYTNDISKPVKETHKLRPMENKIVKLIESKFNINIDQPEIHRADNNMFCIEVLSLMPKEGFKLDISPPLFIEDICPWSSKDTEVSFLTEFIILGGQLDWKEVGTIIPRASRIS